MIRLLLQLIVLLALCATLLLIDARRVLDRPLQLDEDRIVLIEPGQSLASVLDGLVEQGVLPLRGELYLRIYARLTGKATQLKAGEYRVTEGMSPRDALALFVSGKTVLYQLRLIEGWTFAQALAAVHAHPQIRRTPDTADGAAVMAALGQPELSAEGRFFPDAYHFPRGTTDVAFLRRAFETQQRVLEQEWAQRDPDLPYSGPDEALTMASIIEKETGVTAERGQIAGVFVRRLQLGMRLQTDPTVIYGIGETFDGNLRKRDLLADTPYNTYTRGGLPPTPICLPGRAALHAALHPQPGRSLFFVSRGDGTHVFSETLEQHEAAVRRHQLKRP